MTRTTFHRTAVWAASLVCLLAAPASADIKLPAIFSSHMVLQQGKVNPVWGWAEAGEDVSVILDDQSYSTKADGEGRWRVSVAALPAGGPHKMIVAGKNTITLDDVMIGEVWVCSGQSNMQFAVGQANDADLEIRTADFPRIRLITVPQVGTQEPQHDFVGQWQVCSPATVGDFSAVGYFFGRQIHQTLDVPVGLIDNSWGGSACEAWVRRDLLEGDDRYGDLLEKWSTTEAEYDHDAAMAQHEQRLAAWKEAVEKAKAEGTPAPPRPREPRNPLTGQHRPANLYNGVLKPVLGYGIRGVIWYQGETNAGRAYQYRHLFPLMIKSWRDEWGQGDFPFYWVQLADYQQESDTPQESAWAELREAQTMTMEKLPNTGQAVIIDLGEADDIHPKNKQDVGRRLARWALARDYAVEVPYRSPQYQSIKPANGKIVLTFEYAGGGLDPFDVGEIRGFEIAGEDRKFVRAEAEVIGTNQVEVRSDKVSDPVAVRYAWANNPVGNLYSREGLPVTPFRTDDWPGVTEGVEK